LLKVSSTIDLGISDLDWRRTYPWHEQKIRQRPKSYRSNHRNWKVADQVLPFNKLFPSTL
jgi:hypothetical protein